MPPRKRRAAAVQAHVDPQSDSDEEGGGGRPTKFARHGRSAAGRVSTFFQPPAAGGRGGKSLADFAIHQGEEEGLLQLAAQLPERHPNEKAQARRQLEARFGTWWLQLRAGNSLLFYGFGSKHDLLQKFARSETADGACLVVNGFTPGLTAKQVLVWTAAALKQVQPAHYRSYPKQDLLDLIRQEDPHRRIYVIIHNIDGPGLRDRVGQVLLSELAALPNVHLAASCDHVNTPLLWDMQTKDRFSWVWHNATTYAPYHLEARAARLPLLLAGKGGEEASKQSAAVVLASLSHNAREVFRLIADQQLDPAGEQGVSRAKLFQLCRERFLVSNEMLLKQFLVEFTDHDLLGTKRAGDGSDLLHITLEQALLQQVLEDLDHMG